jgi:hypothetical protein
MSITSCIFGTSVEIEEPLINSEVAFGIGIYQHFSNRQLFEKWSKVKIASFALRVLKNPGWTYSKLSL